MSHDLSLPESARFYNEFINYAALKKSDSSKSDFNFRLRVTYVQLRQLYSQEIIYLQSCKVFLSYTG